MTEILWNRAVKELSEERDKWQLKAEDLEHRLACLKAKWEGRFMDQARQYQALQRMFSKLERKVRAYEKEHELVRAKVDEGNVWEPHDVGLEESYQDDWGEGE